MAREPDQAGDAQGVEAVVPQALEAGPGQPVVGLEEGAEIAGADLVLEALAALLLPASELGGGTEKVRVLAAVRDGAPEARIIGAARTELPDEEEIARVGAEALDRVELAPVSEVILDEDAIRRFRQNYRIEFGAAGTDDPLYEAVSAGRKHQGVEHWLPFFHERLETLFDYLPENTVTLSPTDLAEATAHFDAMVADRFEQRGHDTERPILPPRLLFMDTDAVNAALKQHAGLAWQSMKITERRKGIANFDNLDSRNLPPLSFNASRNLGFGFAPSRTARSTWTFAASKSPVWKSAMA